MATLYLVDPQSSLNQSTPVLLKFEKRQSLPPGNKNSITDQQQENVKHNENDEDSPPPPPERDNSICLVRVLLDRASDESFADTALKRGWSMFARLAKGVPTGLWKAAFTGKPTLPTILLPSHLEQIYVIHKGVHVFPNGLLLVPDSERNPLLFIQPIGGSVPPELQRFVENSSSSLSSAAAATPDESNEEGSLAIQEFLQSVRSSSSFRILQSYQKASQIAAGMAWDYNPKYAAQLDMKHVALYLGMCRILKTLDDVGLLHFQGPYACAFQHKITRLLVDDEEAKGGFDCDVPIFADDKNAYTTFSCDGMEYWCGGGHGCPDHESTCVATLLD